MNKCILLLALMLPASFTYFKASPVKSFSQELMTGSIIEDIEEIKKKWKPLQVTGNAVPWELFSTTKEHESCTIDAEGYDICLLKPEYSNEIKRLDGKEVKLMGYMFPLNQSEKQSNFLIGPYPLSCPFHYHIGPTQMVEVLSNEAIPFSYEPVTIKGILELRFNEETGMFYYLNNSSEL